MKRREDWAERLAGYISDRSKIDFEWGRNDCALFVAGAIRAMTGTDLARGLRGYKTQRAGLKKLRAKGHEDHVAVVAAALPEIAPEAAMPGDVGVIDGDGGDALCIVQGRAVYAVGPDGLALVSATALKRAFRL